MGVKGIGFLLLLALVPIFFFSCVSLSVKDNKKIQELNEKILGDFERAVEKRDFDGACRNMIEYQVCCAGGSAPDMLGKLYGLYEGKVKELEEAKNTFGLLVHTYSLLNLAESVGGLGGIPVGRDTLVGYVERFVNVDLEGKGNLERISWLLNLTRFVSGEPFVYRRLVELSIEEKNVLLADKFLAFYEKALRERETVDEPVLSRFKQEIGRLKGQGGSYPEVPIEDTVRSSVKIIVDKGIKTEGGMGTADMLLGTGVVVEKQGYIVTNHHMIESSVDPKYEGYSQVYVVPGKDENVRFTAKIVGYDAVFDLALLKIEKDLESRIRFGDSDALKQGERVTAIGNPVGLTNTVTSGVVSSVDRPLLQIGGIIQIDAALNPGNSGGALIDGRGYLVGIAFAGLQQFENLNFAIPSNLLLSLLFKLHGGGEALRSWIGCSVEKKGDGIVVNYIVPDGPADHSGLHKGDLVREVNGRKVSEIFEVHDLVSYYGTPVVVNLTLERDKKTVVRSVLIEGRPNFPSLYAYKRDAFENVITPLYGIVLGAGESKKRSYSVSRIVSGSIASGAGIAEGDLLKVRSIKYDEKNKVFTMVIEIKSKRFGYLNKPLVLYSLADGNSFI